MLPPAQGSSQRPELSVRPGLQLIRSLDPIPAIRGLLRPPRNPPFVHMSQLTARAIFTGTAERLRSGELPSGSYGGVDALTPYVEAQ